MEKLTPSSATSPSTASLRSILYEFANEECTSYEAIEKIKALFAVSEIAGFDRNAIIEECAKKSECADPHDGRDHAECPFCCNASDIRALKNAAPQEPVSARTGPLQGGSLQQVVAASTGGHESAAAALDTSRSATAEKRAHACPFCKQVSYESAPEQR